MVLDGEYYAATTIVVTTLIIYYGRDLHLKTLSHCQYLPTVFAIIFSWHRGTLQSLLHRALLLNQSYQVIGLHIMQGITIAAASIGLVAMLDVFLGWGIIKQSKNSNTIFGPNTISNYGIFSLLRAFGEEFGWRCYLMPILLAKYNVMETLFISGIIWALFHIPIMILLTARYEVERPLYTWVLQGLSVFLDAYVFGWLSIQTNYSLWAAGSFHAAWNFINPIVLGSVYTNTDGIIKGELWKINGEGLAGCIVSLMMIYLIQLNIS
ncbi:hypothetical protein TrispH2_001700 [Trichoplax sp. H2]|uniref:CAAX prenyl protease 2/Lysostaphin resistance protein A-like domain-containing protein n=1 Tax=Trichoplax adhaerens TaxID=10228 RepID=B3RU91_TRIAD|nr:hypothetical protein TRIADDRAFT_55199 [Trichoplax adhaerens]EDV25295.1 hypothetical protein TRIADDRAFT_55199 [Trichoplax adhaerens]RDD46114.1 hypothetical protein TrispH2_001700 [Trichoplax sp. H2]|eukprot:XP_002111328.1 hypothetical protein TRIADDRAFT_55199 [Trichoplax adhaerens]